MQTEAAGGCSGSGSRHVSMTTGTPESASNLGYCSLEHKFCGVGVGGVDVRSHEHNDGRVRGVLGYVENHLDAILVVNLNGCAIACNV